jgi:hypothetical protein
MGSGLAQYSAAALLALSVGCSNPASPHADAGTPTTLHFSSADDAPPALPAWITHPEVVPSELRGRNNCTFAFGVPGAQWNYYPDGACWERPGPDGWTRQQQYRVYVSHSPRCEGRAADYSPIRVCRAGAAGALSPCPGNPIGPNGCAICVPKVVCH